MTRTKLRISREKKVEYLEVAKDISASIKYIGIHVAKNVNIYVT
jgi:hypothetical protein